MELSGEMVLSRPIQLQSLKMSQSMKISALKINPIYSINDWFICTCVHMYVCYNKGLAILYLVACKYIALGVQCANNM